MFSSNWPPHELEFDSIPEDDGPPVIKPKKMSARKLRKIKLQKAKARKQWIRNKRVAEMIQLAKEAMGYSETTAASEITNE